MAQAIFDLFRNTIERKGDKCDKEAMELNALRTRIKSGTGNVDKMNEELLVSSKRYHATFLRWHVLRRVEESFPWSAYGLRC